MTQETSAGQHLQPNKVLDGSPDIVCIIQSRQNKHESEPRNNNRQSKREEVKEDAKDEAPEMEEMGEGVGDAGVVVVEAA